MMAAVHAILGVRVPASQKSAPAGRAGRGMGPVGSGDGGMHLGTEVGRGILRLGRDGPEGVGPPVALSDVPVTGSPASPAKRGLGNGALRLTAYEQSLC